MKPIPGQITLFEYFSLGNRLRREGYTNVWDKMPEREGTVEVIDREGNRFKIMAAMSFGMMVFRGNNRGHDICWWRYPS